MKYKKESLEKLLLLIRELSSEPENKWFKDELHKMVTSATTENGKSELCFDSFVRLQRKMYRVKAYEFYKGISDCNLKNELSKDYQEMLWFKMLNHVDRYYLFIYYQVENMLNYFIQNKNAFDKIKAYPDSYQIKFSEKFIVKCYNNFFSSKGEALDLVKINSIWAKLVFWALETNHEKWAMDNNSTLWTIVNVRNLLSHKNSSEQNENIKNQIENWKKGDDSALGFAINVLNRIKKTLQ